jgi:hypothetical protein
VVDCARLAPEYLCDFGQRPRRRPGREFGKLAGMSRLQETLCQRVDIARFLRLGTQVAFLEASVVVFAAVTAERRRYGALAVEVRMGAGSALWSWLTFFSGTASSRWECFLHVQHWC